MCGGESTIAIAGTRELVCLLWRHPAAAGYVGSGNPICRNVHHSLRKVYSSTRTSNVSLSALPLWNPSRAAQHTAIAAAARQASPKQQRWLDEKHHTVNQAHE